MIEQAFHLMLISIEIFIPYSGSLKTKRKIVKSLRDRVRNRFNASISELEYHDEWQRSIHGIAMLGNDRQYLDQQAAAVLTLYEENGEIEIVNYQQEWL